MSKKEQDVRFNKFGQVSFTAITKVNDFVDRLEAGQVAGTSCLDCGAHFFPPRADCHLCLSSNMEWFDVAGEGTLITYSKLQYAPAGFEDDVPYCIAVIGYDDYQVFGRLSKELPEEEIKIGMLLKAAVEKLPNGQLTYVFQKT